MADPAAPVLVQHRDIDDMAEDVLACDNFQLVGELDNSDDEGIVQAAI